MLRQLLSPRQDISQASAREYVMAIINFNLLPGGISRELRSEDTCLNTRFSDILLESMKLLLTASMIRKKSQAAKERQLGEGGSDQSELADTQRLMDLIDEIRKSDGTKMGGIFPQLIAQKSTLLRERL